MFVIFKYVCEFKEKYGKSKKIKILKKHVRVLKIANEIEQNVRQFKNKFVNFEKCPRKSRIVRELQNSILIHKIFADSKHDHVLKSFK